MITLDEEFLELDEELNFDDETQREMVVYQPSFEDYFEEESAGLDPSIVLIENEEKWNEALEQFKKTKCFAFDLETYGVNEIDPLFFRNNRIRLIQVGLGTDLCMVADLGGWLDKESFADKVAKYDSFLRVLQEKLEDPEVIVLGVNLKFDFTTIRQHFGFVGVQARDLMIISQVLLAGVGVEKAKAGENRSERCKISHGLKAIAERCGVTLDKSQQTSNWGWRLSNKQLNYAAKDVTVLFELFEVLKPQVLNQGLTYTAFVECNAVSVFSEAEFMGVPVNLEKAKKALDLYEEKIQECVDEFEKYFPGLNWQSNPQVLEAFQEGLEGFSELFVDGKKPSVGKEILNQLEHPAAKALARARKLNTAKNNVKAFVDNSFDGRIRGFYQQNVPGGTGRSSCSAKLSLNRKKYMFGAQLQNPPSGGDESLPSVRSLVEAPEGYAFGIFDGAQMHMRVAAQLSEDKTLLRIYNEDFDGHCLMAAKIAALQGLNWTAEFISGVLGKGPRDAEWEKGARIAYKQYVDSFDYQKGVKPLPLEGWITSIKEYCKTLRNQGKTPLYSCVPMDTECLTKEGWKRYEEVEVGTEILAYNRETQQNEWTPILEKFFYEEVEVIQWKVGKFKTFKSTKNHRWFGKKRVRRKTQCKTSFPYYKDWWFTTEEKSTECIILNSAVATPGPGVELDSLINKYEEDDKWEQLVLDMTTQERWLFFSANIATGGYMVKSDSGEGHYKSCVFTQDITKQPGLFKAMHLCGYLLGYNPVVRPRPDNTCWTVAFNSRPTTTCQNPQMKEKSLSTQPVWCVRTALDTWVIKQEDYITITGNSLNGATAKKITQSMLQNGFEWFTADDGKELFNSFKKIYSGLVSYIRDAFTAANNVNVDFSYLKDYNGKSVEGLWGKVVTLTGRHIYFKKYPNDYRKGQLQVSYTDSTAANWLPAEANLIKHWAVEVFKEIRKHPEWGAWIGNLIHDELSIIFKEEYALEVATMVREKQREVFGSWITVIPPMEEEENVLKFVHKSWDEK